MTIFDDEPETPRPRISRSEEVGTGHLTPGCYNRTSIAGPFHKSNDLEETQSDTLTSTKRPSSEPVDADVKSGNKSHSPVSAVQKGPAQVKTAQKGPAPVRAVHKGPPQVKAAQKGSAPVGANQKGPPQVKTAQKGPAPVSAVQKGPPQVKAAQKGPAPVRAVQKGLNKTNQNLGPSKPKPTEPKPRLYNQRTKATQTETKPEPGPGDYYSSEECQPGSSRPTPNEPKGKQNYQVTRSVQTASDLESDANFEERLKLHKAPVTNNTTWSIYDSLANSTLVCSRKRHSFDDLDLRFDAPPSPAPLDPQLDDLKQVYVGPFEGFVPTPRYERFTNNFLPDEYGQSQRIELTYDGTRSPRAKSHPGDWRYNPHIIYDERQLGLKRLYKPYSSTRWSAEPSEPDESIREDVFKYRKNSVNCFLDISPELPEDQRQFKDFLVSCPSPSSPVRDRYPEPHIEPEHPFVQPRLNRSPSRKSEEQAELEDLGPLNGSRYRRSRSCERRRRRMGRINTLDDQERKIIIEFCHLLEKSKQLFNGLRELPQYGHKQWHAYFGKTFDVYTKLWKFQQQHRGILDSKYGLKRWQIGEIASKIGQLYYHFYLRTSDTAYLHEAYSFYYAIRGRSYYTQACKEDKCELMVKKLRYYARFIVASLLLKKVNLVSELLRELDKQIIEYGNAYEPDDQNEWRIVADEVRTFIEVEAVVEVTHPREYPCALSHRLSAPLGPSNASALERASPMTLTLREALIIGSNSTQLKFSELTMDMYRIMQTLEREPQTDGNHLYDESPRQRNPLTPSAINNKGYNLDGTYNTGEAPHKQMLFKPSPNQIFLYLSSAVDDLPPNGVILLYISAEGLVVPNSKHPEEAGGYDIGGLITTSKTDVLQRETSTSKEGKGLAPKLKEAPVLHPGDLYPFTRRPLFIIIDSDNSYIFNNLPRYFGQPIIILMSPMELPATLYPGTDDQRMEGSLFTLFLHDPLSAVCLCCDIKRMPLEEWERAQATIEAYLKEAAIILSKTRDCMYVAFLSDDFLRLLILRFIFCETILRMHRMFRGRAQRTRCSPAIPDDLYEHPILTRIIMELATKLQVRGHFHDPAAVQRE